MAEKEKSDVVHDSCWLVENDNGQAARIMTAQYGKRSAVGGGRHGFGMLVDSIRF